MKELVSVIIPFYNEEQYIGDCLISLIKRTYKNIEIICVDDGSTDNGAMIVKAIQQSDSRISLLQHEHMNAGTARNVGFSKAKGEYVLFLDSDDFISHTYIEGLYAPIAKGEQLDLVHGGCTNWKNGKPAGINQLYEDYIGDEPDIVFEKFRGLTFSKLFRLENVKTWADGQGLRFDENMRIAEDMAFTLDYLLTVKRYAFVSEVGYYYRIDNNKLKADDHI